MQWASVAGRQRRAAWYARYGRCCRVCGATTTVELHHLRYTVTGREPDEDLAALCRRHHQLVHRRHRASVYDGSRDLAATTWGVIRLHRIWFRLWRPVPPCPWEQIR